MLGRRSGSAPSTSSGSNPFSAAAARAARRTRSPRARARAPRCTRRLRARRSRSDRGTRSDMPAALKTAPSATTFQPTGSSPVPGHLLVRRLQRAHELVLRVDPVLAAHEAQVEVDLGHPFPRRRGETARGTPLRRRRASRPAPTGAYRRCGTPSGSGCRSRRRAPRRRSTSRRRPTDARSVGESPRPRADRVDDTRRPRVAGAACRGAVCSSCVGMPGREIVISTVAWPMCATTILPGCVSSQTTA